MDSLIIQRTYDAFLPVSSGVLAVACVHRYGLTHIVRASAAVLWALSYAVPRAVRRFRRVFVLYYRRTMELA